MYYLYICTHCVIPLYSWISELLSLNFTVNNDLFPLFCHGAYFHSITWVLGDKSHSSPGCINLVFLCNVKRLLHVSLQHYTPSLICHLVTVQPPLTSFILSLSNFPLSLGMIITSLERWQAKNRNQDTVGKNNKLTLHRRRRWIIHPIFLFLPLDFYRKHSLFSIFVPILLLLHQNFIYFSVFDCFIFSYMVSFTHSHILGRCQTHRPTSHIIEQFVQIWTTFHIHKRHHQSRAGKASDTHLAILAQICTKPTASNPIIRLSYTNAVVKCIMQWLQCCCST